MVFQKAVSNFQWLGHLGKVAKAELAVARHAVDGDKAERIEEEQRTGRAVAGKSSR